MLHFTAALMLLVGTPGLQPVATEMRREELMTALQGGGYTVLLRHARTDRTIQEQRDPIPIKRTEQRNLNDQGVLDAKVMGTVFRKYGIRFAEIVSSPMFRTVETAEYAVGTPTRTTMALRVFPSTAEQAALIAVAPQPGTNRLLVTHHFVIEQHVPGIKPGDVNESEAAVVRVGQAGKIELVGRITLSDWEALAGGAQPASAQSQPVATGNRAAAAGVSGYGPQNTATESTAAPATPPAKIALAYVAAFNSRDNARMQSFIETNLIVNPARTMQERMQSYERAFDQLGEITITTGHSSTANEARLGVRGKSGDFFLMVRMSDDQPGRAASLTIANTAGGDHR